MKEYASKKCVYSYLAIGGYELAYKGGFSFVETKWAPIVI